MLSLMTSDSRTFGRVLLVIGGDSVLAVLDPRASGLTIDTTWARRKTVRTFSARGERDPRRMIGVVPSVSFGEIAMSNVAVSFDALRGKGVAILGFDLLGRLGPTIDPVERVLVVRREGRVERAIPGARLPTVTQDGALWILRGDRLLALNGADAWNLLHDKRWTLDSRRGVMVVTGL
jgi:hypothetical protein